MWRKDLCGFLLVLAVFAKGSSSSCPSPLTDMSSSAFSSGKVQHHKYTASQQFIIDHVFAKDGPGYMFWSDSLKLGPQVDALGIGMDSLFCMLLRG